MPLKTPDIAPTLPKKVLEIKPKKGIYLVEPHARWIAEGKKTLIIKSRKFDMDPKEPLYLIEDKVCWGIIYLNEGKEITLEQFNELKEKHLITETDRKKWWENKTPLFAYQIQHKDIWAIPQIVEIPKGIQTFVSTKNIKFKGFKDLTKNELVIIHAFAHEIKHLNLHEEAFMEFNSRGRTHQYLDWLDREKELLIKDWKTYNPMDLIKTARGKRILADDHRIVHTWMYHLLKGKRLMSPQFEKYTITQQKNIVKRLHDQIMRAFKKLGWKHTTPMSKEVRSSLSISLENLQRDEIGILNSWIEITNINFKEHILEGRMLMKDGKLEGTWKLSDMAEESLRLLIEEKQIGSLRAVKVWVSRGDILDIVEFV